VEDTHSVRGAGGTPGGILEFVIGVAMAVAGAYLLTTRVVVTTGFWNFWGQYSFGLTLIPLMVGIAMVFFNGRSFFGWMLVIVGAVIILAGIIANMNIYFQPTSLFNTLMMLALLAGGLGLIAKSVRVH
jgi:uncharacterized protein